MALHEAKVWTTAELTEDTRLAREQFRDERLGETLDDYTKHYAEFEALCAAIVPHVSDIATGSIDAAALSDLLKGDDRFTVFRYLGGPPISSDDMATLSGAPKSSALYRRPAHVEQVRETVVTALDPLRFPWVSEGREPSDDEAKTAAVATALLIAQQKVATGRRNTSKAVQEAAVMGALEAVGFTKVGRRTIDILADAPQPGEFCPESVLGGTRGDIIATLLDGRYLPMECKVSNSSTNSYKRLIHEALGKAILWRDRFGKANVVAAAVLSGVYSVKNLQRAQDGGLRIFWQHRLSDLAEFVEVARR